MLSSKRTPNAPLPLRTGCARRSMTRQVISDYAAQAHAILLINHSRVILTVTRQPIDLGDKRVIAENMLHAVTLDQNQAGVD